MQWSSSLSCGNIPFERARHRCITALARRETAPYDQYHGNFQVLIDTLRAGFAEEERLMENIGFPELVAHRKQHQRVVSALREVASRARRGDFPAASELVALLPNWFLFHWVHMDTTVVVAVGFAAASCAPSRKGHVCP